MKCVHSQLNCHHFARALRDRNKCREIKYKMKLFNTDNVDDFTYISMLDRAHCLLKHTGNLRRDRRFMDSLNADVGKSKMKRIPTYSTGVFMQYHSLSPRYPNLKAELTQNAVYQIRDDQFYSTLKSAKLLLYGDENGVKNLSKLKATKTDKRYCIVKDEQIRIEMIVAIKFYCNYDALCTKFRASLRTTGSRDSSQTIKYHISNFYWLGRFIYSAIEFFGTSPKKNQKTKFYHGLSQKFKFDQFSTVFEIPTSTTWDYNVLGTFTNNGEGIVLQLSPKFKNEGNYFKYLDLDAEGSSDFVAERELLV